MQPWRTLPPVSPAAAPSDAPPAAQKVPPSPGPPVPVAEVARAHRGAVCISLGTFLCAPGYLRVLFAAALTLCSGNRRVAAHVVPGPVGSGGRCRQVERGRPNPGQRVFSVTGAAEAFKLDTDLQARDPDRWAQRGPAEPVSRRLGEQGRPVAVLSLGARFLSVGTGLGWLRFPEGPPGRGGAVAHL